jgi:acyl-homoserine-lactone acylase
LIAGDKFGEAIYVESGPLLDIDDLTLHRCAASPPTAQQGVTPAASNVLDGKQSICAGRTADGRPKLAAADRIPSMVTRGIVYNMNDSYHRSLYGQNRGGYSVLLGDPSRSPGMRKLMAQRNIAECLAAGRVTEAAATEIMLSDRNYAAETTLDGILGACRGAAAASGAARACSILAGWDRRNNVDSRGALMFRAAWPLLEVIPGFYAEPFDPVTPFRERTVATGSTVVAAILADLTQAEMALRTLGLHGDEPWGEMLARPTPRGRVRLHGGDGKEGVLNALTGARLQSDGFSDIVLGTSYVHVVTWENGRVHAKVMLAHGQSLDPDSPHFADQLPMFAQKQLADAEFTDSEISADPTLDVLRLRE